MTFYRRRKSGKGAMGSGRAIVVGGGIGGLAAAVALHRHG
jgi:NADPH-dependent 2,4-dienoyl-CoA reductase/sulfur reductase-like enzyme